MTVAVGGFEELERRDGRRVEPHSFVEAERLGMREVRKAAGPQLCGVCPRRRSGFARCEILECEALESRLGPGAAEPVRGTPGDRDLGPEWQLGTLGKKRLAGAEESENFGETARRESTRVEAPRG
jgi:hypothetical protein